MMTETEMQKRMYGMTEAELRAMVEDSITVKVSGPAMFVAGMLSDAQEMTAWSQTSRMIEEQRQLLNRAKWILFTYIMDKERV